MTTIQATVDVDLRALEKYGVSVQQQLYHQRGGPVARVFKKWAVRYRSFISERFDRFSKGGGSWPDLKESTKRRRRLGKGRKYSKVRGKTGKVLAKALARNKQLLTATKFAILRDLGLLFAAVSPTFTGAPGQLEQNIPFGIRVGFGGPSKHGKGRATVADIAAMHQKGEGHLPKREIIVSPTLSVTSLMASDMDLALKQIADGVS